MAMIMPIVCVNRPVRKEPRRFSENDVGRIYCKVIDQGVPRETVIKAVNKKCPDADICDCLPLKSTLIKVFDLLKEIVSNILGPLNVAVILINALVLRIPVLRRIPGIRRIIEILNRVPLLTAEIEAVKFVIGETLDEIDPPQLPDADF